MSFYPNQPDPSQYGSTGVPQQQRQARSRSRAPTSTSPYAPSLTDDYLEPIAHSQQYATHTSAIPVPQQRRSSLRPHSISPNVSSSFPAEQSHGVYPSSYNGTSQVHFSDPTYDFLDPAAQGNPGFPEVHPSRSPNRGGLQLQLGGGHPGQNYARGGGGGAIQRSHSGQPDGLYGPTGSSDPRYSGRTGEFYPTPTFDSTYPAGPQQRTPHQTHLTPHGHGVNPSIYQTGAPGTRITHEPPYRGVHPQEGVVSPPQYFDDHPNEGHRAKGPGRGPAGGRVHNCRMPNCNRPVYFDRRFNELSEWCSQQHVLEAVTRRVEKACRNCGVWPRRYGYRYCGGEGCNKQGYQI